MIAQLKHMLACIVLGVEGGGVDVIAAYLVKRMRAFAIGMELSRVHLIIAHHI